MSATASIPVSAGRLIAFLVLVLAAISLLGGVAVPPMLLIAVLAVAVVLG